MKLRTYLMYTASQFVIAHCLELETERRAKHQLRQMLLAEKEKLHG